MGGEGVDPGAAGVAEAEELGDLVEGFAGGVVYRVADVAVVPAVVAARCGEIEVGVAAGDDEGEEWAVMGARRAGASPEDGVDVAFEVVDGDEGLAERRRRGLWRR